MPKSPFVLVLVAILLLGFVVPTGASSGDHLWDDPNVVLAPGSGPGGEYASLNGDGELEVDLSSPGVNANAYTAIDGVFTVSNEDADTVAIWFSHNETDEVVLSVDGRSAQLEDDPIVLTSGEQVSVDLSVDSSSRQAGDLVLSSFTIHAENVTETTTSSDGGSTTSTSTSTSTSDEVVDEQEAPSVEPTPPSGEDEVVYADGVETEADFTPIDPSAVGRYEAAVGDDGPFGPEIQATMAPRGLDGGGALRPVDGAHGLARVDDTVALTADGTRFASAEAIQPNVDPVRLVDVDVPARRTGEPALIRLAIDRDRLGTADPTTARIGRFTPSGWQLLTTTVAEADGERVVLEAMTPGPGTFAVFQEPDVDYAWRLPDGTGAGPPTVTTGFDEPGHHTVELTVTDGQGRQATAEYRVLANDRPAVEIVTPSDIDPGDPIALQADVTDQVGSISVTWRFADGSTAGGAVIERSFSAGEQGVQVVVRDEYGAETTATTTLVVGDAARVSRTVVDLAQLGLDVEDRLAVTAVAILLLVVGFREWVTMRPRRTRVRRVR